MDLLYSFITRSLVLHIYSTSIFSSTLPQSNLELSVSLSLECLMFKRFCVFPLFVLLSRVLQWLEEHLASPILITPAWPTQSWFPSFLPLSWCHSLHLPDHCDMLSQFQGTIAQPSPEALCLHAWRLSSSAFVTVDGFSEKVTERISLTHGFSLAGSTVGPYVLGIHNRILILSMPLMADDFLLYLLDDKHLQPLTMKDYWAVMLPSPYIVRIFIELTLTNFLWLLFHGPYSIVCLMMGLCQLFIGVPTTLFFHSTFEVCVVSLSYSIWTHYGRPSYHCFTVGIVSHLLSSNSAEYHCGSIL